MTDYLLLFRNSSGPTGYLTSTQEMAEDLPKWQRWIGEIAGKGRLVNTAPVQYEAAVVTSDAVHVGHPYKEANSILVSGYLICKAESQDELIPWSKGCPILRYPNSSVEIRPLVPFPVN